MGDQIGPIKLSKIDLGTNVTGVPLFNSNFNLDKFNFSDAVKKLNASADQVSKNKKTPNPAPAEEPSPKPTEKKKSKTSANEAIDNFCKRMGVDPSKLTRKERAALKKLAVNDQAQIDKFEATEKLKETKKASNNMTYKQIMSALYKEYIYVNWGGVVTDKKTGKPRFPNLGEIREHLKYLASIPGPLQNEYRAKLERLESLLAAKKELEEKYPDIKNVEYTVIVDAKTGEKRYWPGSIHDDRLNA